MRSPSSTKSVVRNGKKSARKKWRTSTKSVVRNGKKPGAGGKKRSCLPRISRGHFFLADYLRSRKTGKRGTTRSLYVAALAQPSKSLMRECAL